MGEPGLQRRVAVGLLVPLLAFGCLHADGRGDGGDDADAGAGFGEAGVSEALTTAPAYHTGFYDAQDGEPLFAGGDSIYEAGWRAFWACKELAKSEITETTARKARRLGLDCDYVSIADCGYRGMPSCCQYNKDVAKVMGSLNVCRSEAEFVISETVAIDEDRVGAALAELDAALEGLAEARAEVCRRLSLAEAAAGNVHAAKDLEKGSYDKAQTSSDGFPYADEKTLGNFAHNPLRTKGLRDIRTSPPFDAQFKGVQFFALSKGQWFYVNHAETWQTCPPPVVHHDS